MDAQKVDMFLLSHGKYFESSAIPAVREKLLQMDDSLFVNLQATNFKDPTTLLIVSLFGGNLGIDRFMLGDTGLGVAKLLTCGGFYIWTIVDWFSVMSRTKKLNLEKFNNL